MVVQTAEHPVQGPRLRRLGVYLCLSLAEQWSTPNKRYLRPPLHLILETKSIAPSSRDLDTQISILKAESHLYCSQHGMKAVSLSSLTPRLDALVKFED